MKKGLLIALILLLTSFFNSIDATKIRVKGTWTVNGCNYEINGWVDVNFFTGTVNCYDLNISSSNPKCGGGNFSIPC